MNLLSQFHLLISLSRGYMIDPNLARTRQMVMRRVTADRDERSDR